MRVDIKISQDAEEDMLISHPIVIYNHLNEVDLVNVTLYFTESFDEERKEWRVAFNKCEGYGKTKLAALTDLFCRYSIKNIYDK